MKLNQEEAIIMLSNLDMFVSQYEAATNKKMTQGAMQIVHELLTAEAFPEGAKSHTLN